MTKNYKQQNDPRKIARELGDRFYKPHKPCPKHPLARFSVGSGQCEVCTIFARQRAALTRAANRGQ
jgi:hypothetical protein